MSGRHKQTNNIIAQTKGKNCLSGVYYFCGEGKEGRQGRGVVSKKKTRALVLHCLSFSLLLLDINGRRVTAIGWDRTPKANVDQGTTEKEAV